MSILQLAKKIAIKIMNKQKNVFSVDINEQKNFIKKLGVAHDDIERSYYQYKCQSFLKGKWVTLLQNIVGVLLTQIYYPKYIYNGKKSRIMSESCDAVFLHEDKPINILPESLKEKYKKIVFQPKIIPILSRNDNLFLQEIFAKQRFSPFFKFRCMNDIAEYSFLINKYNPKTIITCYEYSFTSSVLTMYCNRKGISHVNVMHGEKVFFIRDSYFKFNSCYVWDKHYSKLFKNMNACEKQFIIAIPPALKIEDINLKEPIRDFTYYLGDEDYTQLKKIKHILTVLNKGHNYIISIRPHPRYSNIDSVKSLLQDFYIEDTKQISIENSILSTRCAISLRSTALLQASLCGIDVVIDDMTNPKMFEKLKQLNYIVLNKKHMLLSQILSEDVREGNENTLE